MKRSSGYVLAVVLLSVLLAGCASPQVPPTATSEPATETSLPPTATSLSPTATSAPVETAPTATSTEAVEPTDTPAPEPPTAMPTPAPSWQADGMIGEREYVQRVEATGVTLHWSNDAQYLYAALSARTAGWVAVGFDPELAMLGANYVFGYVQEGQLYVADMYGTLRAGRGSHPPDEELGGSDDILEAAGLEEAGTTVIEFKIPLDSGDEYDKVLQPGSSYTVLLAWGAEDDYQSYHGGRGTGQITLD